MTEKTFRWVMKNFGLDLAIKCLSVKEPPRKTIFFYIDEFLWKLPMHINFWLTRMYAKYYFNPRYYKGA